MCGHGQNGVSVTDWTQTCLWTRRERGMCLATEKPLPLEKLEKSLESSRPVRVSCKNRPDAARKLPGNSLDDSSDVARTPSRTLRGLLSGCQPVCCVIYGADCYGNCQVACEPLRQPWCGHSPALCETFPANCSDTARKLPGNCPDDSADTAPDTTLDAARTAAWTAAVITKSFANHRANFGANFGANIHRSLVRRFPPTARTRLGSCSVIARMIHRMLRRTLRGNCPEIARPLLVFRPYFLIRGWCLTKMTGFPIPESRQRFRSTEHLKLMRP